MERIDGSRIAQEIIEELTAEVAALEGINPSVTFLRVGEDPASVSYVNKKSKVAGEIGIESNLQVYPDSISQGELLDEISTLKEKGIV